MGLVVVVVTVVMVVVVMVVGQVCRVGVSVSDKTIASYIMFYVHYTSWQARSALGSSARIRSYLVQKAPAWSLLGDNMFQYAAG